MPILSVEKISKDFRHKPLFNEVTFSIDWSERLGLIGTNGSGKTTLMRIVSGEQHPDGGKIEVSEGSRVGYLPQNPMFEPEETVLDAIFSRNSDALSLIHDYEAACQELIHNHDDPAISRRISELSAKIDAAGAWEIETNAKIILAKLGVDDLEAKMGQLSGGQRKRVALAHSLIVQPDLLMLDEPTNHLDAETISWLEQYLSRYSGALLLVTHDRYFLDRVTDHILEIDRGTTQIFNGNYAYYLEKKEEQEENRRAEGQKRRSLAKRELAWLRRGAKARSTKQKARVDRAHELIDTPAEQEKEQLDIKIAPRKLGSKVIDFDKVTKSYGDKKLVNDFTYSITRGERIGIIGANGSGKTTLLEMITERTKPTSGKVEVGSSVVIGYYDQESRDLNENQRVIDYIRDVAEYLPAADGKSTISASQMLERFLFPPEIQYAIIGNLSGGERRRLYLLRLLMGNPNVLLLDEPTNDLDIPTLVALEAFLDDFEGTLIVVSHDRYFLDRTIDHIFRFEGDGRIREYPGDYSAFLEIKEREEKEAEAKNSTQKKETSVNKEAPAKKKKLSFKEQKEYESLEKEIAQLGKRKAELEADLVNCGSDFTKLQAVTSEIESITKTLEQKENRWVELAELI